MLPNEIRDAVLRNLPIIIGAGCVEYHGPQLPIGTDILMCEGLIHKIEESCECVIMPSLPFSPTMFWAGGAKDGEFNFSSDALYLYAREMLKGILEVGFRRIYIIQHHQGAEGLPSVTLKKAALDTITEITDKWNDGWGCSTEYNIKNIFSLIKVIQIASFVEYKSEESEKISFSHGGKGETQFIMATHENLVDLAKLDETLTNTIWWLKDAKEAKKNQGEEWLHLCVEGWVKELKKEI